MPVIQQKQLSFTTGLDWSGTNTLEDKICAFSYSLSRLCCYKPTNDVLGYTDELREMLGW